MRVTGQRSGHERRLPAPVVVGIVGLDKQNVAFARDRINAEAGLAVVYVVDVFRRHAAATGDDSNVQRVQRPDFGRHAVICRNSRHLTHQHAVDDHLRQPRFPSHHGRRLTEKGKDRVVLDGIALRIIEFVVDRGRGFTDFGNRAIDDDVKLIPLADVLLCVILAAPSGTCAKHKSCPVGMLFGFVCAFARERPCRHL